MGSVLVSGKAPSSSSTLTSTYVRRAHHAGSWYSDDTNELRDTLTSYLADAATDAKQQSQQDNNSNTATDYSRLRAVIVPHAGYRYSGPTAAYSYRAVEQRLLALLPNDMAQSSPASDGGTTVNQNLVIVVLHPSHHVYLDGCAVSGAHVIETPVGNLPVDDALRDEILQLNHSKTVGKHASDLFTVMTQSQDEHEHSGEMQYPYLALIVSRCAPSTSRSTSRKVTAVPIMVGSISTAQEQLYGQLLSPILARPNVLTVVSSDFCHWGSRFSYRPTPPSTSNTLSIYEFIEQLDRQGMDYIEWQQPGAFAKYLHNTRNTICGRHAIAVWLNAVVTESSSTDHHGDSSTEKKNYLQIKFVKYAQSSAVESMHDSSVSYAAAVATLLPR